MLGIALLNVSVTFAQTYPNKPIRIVSSEAGGAIDFAARIVAQGLSAGLGQSVIVDNRGGGIIPGDIVAHAPPDGYTLLMAGGTFILGPLLQKTPYDVVNDFAPITLVATAPNILVVHPSLNASSVAQLIALAKTKPGELNYGSGAIGGAPHLAMELFNSMAGVNIVRINYKGTTSAITDLLANQVQVMVGTVNSVNSHVKSGRLRALAVTSLAPSELAPGLPAVAATLPGYQSISINSVFAPAKTPSPIVNRLNQVIVAFIKTPAAKEKLFRSGADVMGSSSAQLAAIIQSEMERMRKVIKDADIHAS
jgi:tripartite-type tricarboxylate transporter receptor subunit TctC